MIFPQRKGLPVQTGGGFPYKGDSPRKIGGPHTESKPERRFSPRRLLRRGRNAAAEARISGNINSAASGRKNAHSSNNFFLRYPPRAMRGGYRRFSEKCRFRRGITGQFPSRAKSSGRPRCGGRRLCAYGESLPHCQKFEKNCGRTAFSVLYCKRKIRRTYAKTYIGAGYRR